MCMCLCMYTHSLCTCLYMHVISHSVLMCNIFECVGYSTLCVLLWVWLRMNVYAKCEAPQCTWVGCLGLHVFCLCALSPPESLFTRAHKYTRSPTHTHIFT